MITREAAVGMYDAGQGRRFGWPNDDGRPEHLADAVEWLATEMGLEVGVAREDVDEDDKDGGVDVVVWRPFRDRRPSFPVLLIQCTMQATFERKPADVIPEMWIAWSRFGREPTIGLSIPFALPPDAKVRLSKLRYTAGAVFDRLRLCELLRDRDLTSFPEFAGIHGWTETEIAAITAAIMNPPIDRSRKNAKPRLARRRRARKIAAATGDVGAEPPHEPEAEPKPQAEPEAIAESESEPERESGPERQADAED